MTPRRHTDEDDTGVLSRRANHVWKVLVFVSSILAAGGSGLVAARAFAADAAKDVMRPVESRLESHLSEMVGKTSIMEAFVEQTQDSQCATARNVYLLCMQARIRCEPVSAPCNGRH